MICCMAASPCFGQGFLNKISKGLDKVNSELDKLAGKDNSQKQTSPSERVRLAEIPNVGTNSAYREVAVRSFSPEITLSLENCVREGTKITITYFLTNNGADFTILELGVTKNVINKTEETLILDNNGRGYELRYYSLGQGNEQTRNMTLPTGIRLKGELEIYNVPVNVKQLSMVNIAGYFDNGKTSSELVYFSFAFRNVPIYTARELLSAINATPLLTVKEPFVAKSINENFTVEAVEFTDKYTKVDISYKNTTFNPVANLYLGKQPSDIYISAEGNTYALIDFWGITPREGDVQIKLNDTGHYSYIFEPVPSSVAVFDIAGEEINGIIIKSNINITPTTGMFKSLDTKYDAFYKQSRMTATDRTYYRIDNIKHPNLPKPCPNNQLAKGKSIYKCDDGRIETFLVIIPDNLTDEYLVSYDKVGNVIDCICIGNISAYGGDRGYANISADKVTVYSSYPSEGEDDGGEKIEEYKIGNNLKFNKQN